MAERLLVWGAGGHGRVVADLARLLGYDVVGFVDRNAGRVDFRISNFDPSLVISEGDLLQDSVRSKRWAGVRVALGVGNNSPRLRCLDQLSKDTAVRLIHPSASISPSASVGRASVVFAQAVVNAGAQLGEAVIVNTSAVVEHDCSLGEGTHISPGAILAGGVTIGRAAWVGAGAVVIPGVTVGENSVIGAGAIVVRDVPANVLAVGNPARVVRPLAHPGSTAIT